MPPIISPATPADLPAIFELLQRSALPRDGLDAHVATTLVARDANGLVGTAALELYGTAALLRSVAVAAEQRGRGLGAALTATALDLARRRGVRILPQVRVPADPPPRRGSGRARLRGVHDRLPRECAGDGPDPLTKRPPVLHRGRIGPVTSALTG